MSNSADNKAVVRRLPGHRHDQAGGAGDGGGQHARPLEPLGGADAAGVRAAALREALDSTELLAQATDDAMLVEWLGGRVLLHEAPAQNIKVTTPLDLRIAEVLLAIAGTD